ncbi:hypothetical protein X769_30680 [Mesorhizobium sp. LSJC268A00]|nr:hypothetical protein X769_30680 [Mesorhizobium sp. LSJC268A00]ESX85946.1 hypothetical protein X754_29020 [Mesorhizobium sp. LNJC403B00]
MPAQWQIRQLCNCFIKLHHLNQAYQNQVVLIDFSFISVELPRLVVSIM